MDQRITSSLGVGLPAHAAGADAFFGDVRERYAEIDRERAAAQQHLDDTLSDIGAFANGWGKNAATSSPWEAASRAEQLPKEFMDPSQMIVLKVLRRCEYSDKPGELIAVVAVVASYLIDCKLCELATDEEVAAANARAQEQADIQAKGPEHGTSNAGCPHSPTDGHALRKARIIHCPPA